MPVSVKFVQQDPAQPSQYLTVFVDVLSASLTGEMPGHSLDMCMDIARADGSVGGAYTGEVKIVSKREMPCQQSTREEASP